MSWITRMLALHTGLQESAIHRIMVTAPVRYKTFFIPKRNGELRQISQPAREVKLVQRAFSEIILKKLPVHPCATAYIDRKSILHNAQPHAGHGQIVKMDFKNFFPSIRRVDWIHYCQENSIFDSQIDADLSSSLLFQKNKNSGLMRLAIGAPSSPILSNILMYNFDYLVSKAVLKDHVTYTRYADDMTFSAPRTGHLVNVVRIVKSVCRSLNYPRVEINENKTVYATAKYKRAVTGLILTNDGRVTIGRDQKRLIRAMVHHAINTNLTKEALERLAGNLAYINSVEPAFMETLTRKYGAENIQRIRCIWRKDSPKNSTSKKSLT